MERDGAEARVGITQYAADALGDVVFAELPEQGRQVVLHVLDDLCPPIPYWLWTRPVHKNLILEF